MNILKRWACKQEKAMEGSEQKAGEGKEEACMNEKWQEKT